jgi:hypothetical protein
MKFKKRGQLPFFLTFIFSLLVTNCYAAEFLVYAKTHWMEKVDRSEWGAEKLKEYNRRYLPGNPVVVMPDGHEWGRLEGPPSFVIIKVPGLSVEEGRQYLERKEDLTAALDVEGKPPTKYRRKWQLPPGLVNSALNQGGIRTMNSASFKAQIIDRQ